MKTNISKNKKDSNGKTAGKIRFIIIAVFSLLASYVSSASHYETISFIPEEGIEEFIVEKLDLTSFRNSLGPARSPGMRYFSDMGLAPTEISEGRIVFETETWYYCIELIERRDINHEGVEDIQITFTDESIEGTYLTEYIYLLTGLSDESDLIAIAYGPSGYLHSERNPGMSEGLIVPWSEQSGP